MKFEDYSSWEAYVEAYEKSQGEEKVSHDKIIKFVKLMGEGLRFYFDRHLPTLSSVVVEEVHSGVHPSQSHDRVAESEPFLGDFVEYLASKCSLPIVEGPNISFYHMDLIVFDVTFDSEVSWADVDKEIPSFYKGFRIMRIRKSESDAAND